MLYRSAPSRSPKLIAVDLDGTLLDHQGKPHARDVAALRAAAAEGVTVSILTGRLYSGARASAGALGIRGPVGCADGSHVVLAADHSTLHHNGISGAHALQLRDSLARLGPATFLFAEDAIVHDDEGAAFLGYVSTWSEDIRRTDRIADHDFWFLDGGITAIVAVGTGDQIHAVADDVQATLSDHAQVAVFPIGRGPRPTNRRVGQWGLVARAAGHSKGSALAWLAAHHGYDISETVVVGDWFNDVSMFAVAGRSYAMGQAPDDVKKFATASLSETSVVGGGIARVVADVFGVKS